jgi:CRP-like cAMP-binding protein
MALDRDIALLSRVGLFQGFTPEQLRLIAFGSEREKLGEGTVLYREGEAAGGGYVVADGQIDLVLNKARRQIVLESCMEGGLVGEIALITSTRRATDAVACHDSEVLYVPRSLFHRMLREYPETAAFLHGRIAQSVRRLVAQIEEVNTKLGVIKPLMGGQADKGVEPAETEEPEGGG